MSLQPILPIKVSITIDTMLNVDGDFDDHGEGRYLALMEMDFQIQVGHG